MVSQAKRWDILKRDKFRCLYCGNGVAEGAKLEVDHVVPVSAGGLDEDDNLVTACRACNNAKRGEILDDAPVLQVGAVCVSGLGLASIARQFGLDQVRLRYRMIENGCRVPPDLSYSKRFEPTLENLGAVGQVVADSLA